MNGRTNRAGARGAALALLALTATGCAGARGPATPPAATTPGPTAAPRTAPPAMPTRQEQERLHLAEQRLVATCMRGRGFTYTATPLGGTGDAPPVDPYGSGDEARARAEGYGLAAFRARDAAERRTEERARRTDPNHRYAASLPPDRREAYDTALLGTRRDAVTVRLPGLGTLFTSADGCLSEARGTLYGDLRKWTRAKAVMSHLRTLTAAERERDPRWTRALDAWRSCMRKAGFPYGTPAEARLGVQDAGPDEERRTAVADARCNRAAGLAKAGARTEEDHIGAAVAGRFREEADFHARAVARVLAGPARTPGT
ncbi:hypothetical protein [Streptomyces sp. CC77]|uniref:hypothetical protein n=1 Tax=Streptomyces sp. CC77 TaxID=1906739 RepID=UPI0008DD340C|nr:hypothetical protein [Streptomyces sp. CC77]OII61872.1 hypothetical protein BJP39_10585 [Streptomyces sp. CC77]